MLAKRFKITARDGLAAMVAVASMNASVLAVEPDEVLNDPVLEQRAREIGRELRCVTCQSQSIDDSNAPLAKDLRLVVRERLLAGDSDDEIVAYVTDRYGDYVRLKPEVRGDTLLLWLTPLLALGGAMAGAFFYFRQHAEKTKNLVGEDPTEETDV